MPLTSPGGPGPLSPVLHELGRIAGAVESARSVADQQIIAALQREVAELRTVVAYLRAGAGPVPTRLRPVVARAVLAAADEPACPG